ncbi:Probable inactive tRNA-specific adenosine deaminase-like protein 3 [Gryllus bimaculatus]|nr:Probable inactive tRNA-specific adenosine deaminase-like protein 3 [Gryllus bimaculatus]
MEKWNNKLQLFRLLGQKLRIQHQASKETMVVMIGKILRIARAPTAKKIEESVSNASGKDSLPYLCTGLDVVMTHEPCAMCAMALTHARTRCVFFSEDNSNCGVLYSHSPPLQILPGLNHRLQVFHAYLPEGKR